MTFTVVHEEYPIELQAIIDNVKRSTSNPISIEMAYEYCDRVLEEQPQTSWQAYMLVAKVIWRWMKLVPTGRFNMELEIMGARMRRSLRQTKFVWR